ncbi:hypothetical protein BCR41DRAFT_358761 [Lobosporangium transversale]|uniref:C2H2-type domain-containing protein n=1 Tax=Lobosporangium transversale TaxID=64571 RepID=A0A1Y2GJ63_9FUNG|nr:hypothetical protein BCR41DRAFT_358761 [Lobosporangium transversale]ORZ09031.1 hypothetical protein BCR41DRAFT_358761 [Lobosporangium transversale]|eukprot:XP_021878658.1 hypothetical protein BCR41DRAFT_358761 [Lobosporangium transversale]
MASLMRCSKKRRNDDSITVLSESNDVGSEDDVVDDKEIEKIVCDYCSKIRTFESIRKLTVHIGDCHTVDGVVALGKRCLVIRRSGDGQFYCKECKASFETKSGFRKHLFGSQSCYTQYEAKRDSDAHPVPSFQSARPPQSWRPFNEALIHACGLESSSEQEKQKMLYYSDRMGQFPMGISISGCEFDALVSETVYHSLPTASVLALVNKSVHASGYLPPWKIQENERSDAVPPSIEGILRHSPFAEAINKRSFTELTDSTSEQLNLSWERTPQACHIASHLLSGTLLLNSRSETLLLINEVEVYGRGRLHDSHHEQTGIVKDVPKETSMPKTTGEDHYFGVRPITMERSGGKHLVIGTFKCDILVTSCLRLDIKCVESISAGGITQNFNISESESKYIRIFLDKERLQQVEKMENLTCEKITRQMGTEQLRQVRTKFHLMDTYQLSRRSGPLTDSTLFQPITVFTFANHSNVKGSSFAAGIILNGVGKSVIVDGECAVLRLDDVKRALPHCKPSSEVLRLIQSIHALFTPGVQSIPIIENSELNTVLESLATFLTQKLPKANMTKVKEIKKLFIS